MNLSRTISAVLFASAFMLTLSACDQKGPFEEAGEKIDEKAEEARDAIEDATNGG